MKARIRQRALELGFDQCRITSAAPPDSAAQFERWLAQGHHGTMAYLARSAARRLDPQRVLPGARSVVVLGAGYWGRALEGRPDAPAAGPEEGVSGGRGQMPTGLVARYARFADYHEVLGRQVRALAEFVAALGGPGTHARGYVDTGPVLERALAQRAGLGFVGKHTNLISRRQGNWLFVAVVLTTLELEPDPPERPRCGTCARCLAACPTGAIVAPFQLDARRCLAYLTIEFRGPIPPQFRPALGRRIFGCDTCLEVCPWNRWAVAGRLMAGHARPDLAAPDLLALLTLDEARFQERFGHTPLNRAGHRGLRRNVCVALGNVGGPEALPALARVAAGPDPLLAEHARWAVEQIEQRPATPGRPGD